MDPEEPPQPLPPRRLEGSIVFGSDVSGWQDVSTWLHIAPPTPPSIWRSSLIHDENVVRISSQWRKYGIFSDTEPSIYLETIKLGETDEVIEHAWWVGDPRGLAKISIDVVMERLLDMPCIYESKDSEKPVCVALVYNPNSAYSRYHFVARIDGWYWLSFLRHVFEQEWLPEFHHRVSYPILRWMNKRGLAYTPEGCVMSWRDIGKKKPKEHRVIATTKKLLVNKYKDIPDEQRDELLRDFQRSYEMALEGRMRRVFISAGDTLDLPEIDKNRTISEESDAADAWKFLKSSLTKMPADYRGESRRIDILGEVGQAKDDGE